MAMVEIGSNRGRDASHTADFLRPLVQADLPWILSPPKGPAPEPLKQLRARHHSAARLIAEGRSMSEVSAITGYALSRISILKHSPDFVELVAHYKSIKDALYLDVHARRADLAASVIDELQDRLEENPEKFSPGQLTDLLKVALPEQAESTGGTRGIDINITYIGAKPETAPGVVIDGELSPE
jgi:hypothetical protein